MKDYSFGNYICALRTGLGLSQFQLGTLVGVSDKAVSKWENGDAKPRIGTCYRLAEVLGVSINELLSCNTALPARKELNNMKRKLWNEVYKRLSIYGDPPPVLCWSRLAAEKTVLEETDAILSMAVLARIMEAAEKRNTLVIVTDLMSSSFAAWLLGATTVNPLPPHYRCPQCRKTEFISHIKNGFDLPTKHCNCGAEMIRDGHDLPHDSYTKDVQMKSSIEFRVSPEFMPVAAKIIKDFYHDKATILPVKYTDVEDEREACSERYVVLSDREDVPPVSKDGFWHAGVEEFWYWWKDEIMYTMICDNRIHEIQILQEKTQTIFPNPLQHTSPEMFESLYQRKCCDPAHTAASTKKLCENLPHNFDLLIKLDGFTHASGAWCDQWVNNGKEMCESNGEKLVREGRATIHDIPAYREDIWNDVSTALAVNCIRYSGLAVEVMERARKGQYWGRGMPTEVETMLLSLGLPDWYPEYLKNVKYLFPKGHCISLLLCDIIFEWYRIHYPKVFHEIMATNT